MKDLVVLITGASSGIGESTARELVRRGAKVVLCARRTDLLEKVAADLRAAGGSAIAVACDVTKDGDCEAAVARAVAEWGRLDVLLANAGFAVAGRVEALSIDDYRRQLETNFFGSVRAVKAARERGLRVPEDLSVVGFDDASCAIETWPHLTTMRVDAEEMGRLAVRRLVARINGHKGPAEESILVSRLVARDSTTFPKGARGGSHLEMRKQSENMIPCNLQGVPT